MFQSVGKKAWIIFNVLLWGGIVWGYGINYVFEVYRKTDFRIVLECLAIFTAIPVVYYFAQKVPVFTWHLGRLFGTRSKNIGIMPLTIRYWSILFGMVFLMVIPHVARFEEELFRKGTSSIPEAILRSILFGFAHMLMGVNGSAALALTVLGGWLSYRYMVFGLDSAILGHALYNSIWTILMVIAFNIATPPTEAD